MTDYDILRKLTTFLSDYHREDLARIAQGGTGALTVDHAELYQFDPDLADYFLDRPETVLENIPPAIKEVDLPTPQDLSDTPIRVTNLPSENVHPPGHLRKEHGETYVGVRGVLDRVTSTSDLPLEVSYECQRCGSITTVPQSLQSDELQEPHECGSCERQGPFVIDHNKSEWSDYAKLRIKSRPDAGDDAAGKLPGYVLDDLIDEGGEDGLFGRAGEPVTAYGILRRTQKTGRQENNLLFDHVLDVRAVEFDRDDDTVRVADHRDTFETLAARDDAVDLFAQSIAPQLHTTDAWDAAMEFAVAYLFGAPRIDLPQGPTYRGDLHLLIVSDYGTGKSTFKEDVEAFSPKCLSKSTTALSSGVGLTAAAVKDDFGEGQWTLKPGLLVRANGGHLIMDEIDKGPDELTDMNDALEGEQVVDIEKAGQSATYESRTAVMALGNPVDGRFNEHDPIAEQLGISESLLSRFDGIVTMTDTADEQQDSNVAETWGRAYTEAQEAEYGDRDTFDTLDRPVPIDVGQAWIKHARENVNPLLRFEQFEELKEWYATEVRQLNNTFAGEGEGSDMPVPATVRELAAAAKLSIAFARVHLREEVAPEDVERAKKLGKRLVKQHWTGDRFDATHNVSQASAIDRVRNALRHGDDLTVTEVSAVTDLPEPEVEDKIDKLSQEGHIFEPEPGVYSWA